MELTYHGHSCIRLRGKEMTVVIDPPQLALPGLAKGTVGLIVRTEGTTDSAKLRPRDGEVQEVAGPGEFEIGGVSILGLKAGETTVMRIAVDEVIDGLGHVDVLVIPVGGGDALGAIEAAKLVNAVEPSIVVPARYGASVGGEYDPVGKFAQEMGLAEGTWEAQPRLVLSGSSGETDETRVVFLEARAN
jgi:L-ascorbate metabolism protein UlaG (beta-lactamase superfamily)